MMLIPEVTRPVQVQLRTHLSRLPSESKGLESNGAADVCTITPRLTKTATRERKIAMASKDDTPLGVTGQSWQSLGEVAKRILEKQGRK